jgi:hypothetical protein
MCSTEGLNVKATVDNNTSADIATTAIRLRPNLDPPAMNKEPRSSWLAFCAPFNADAETGGQRKTRKMLAAHGQPQQRCCQAQGPSVRSFFPDECRSTAAFAHQLLKQLFGTV